jgi:DNA-binding transcriptional LysR family regulator
MMLGSAIDPTYDRPSRLSSVKSRSSRGVVCPRRIGAGLSARRIWAESADVSKPARTPDLDELRAFCAAVDLGSLGGASRLLQISQPSLSKRLRNLEALAGSQLLERAPGRVSPTPAGRQLYGAARRLLAEAEAVEALMEGLTTEGAPVRLAASPTIAEVVLPPIMVDLESRHERHLSVELSIANSLTVRALVLEARVDIGVAATTAAGQEASGLCEAPFCEDEIVVAVPEGHSWTGVEEIDPEFVAERMIMRDPGADSRRAVSDRVEALGMSLAPPLAEIGSTTAAITTATARRAPALLSSLAFSPAGRPGLVVRRVAGFSFRRRFAVLHNGEEGLSPRARSLLGDLLAARPS